MEVGFAVPMSGPWATPDNVARVARRAEELGYASLWTFQRLLWPVEITGPAAAPYREVIDPVATLGYLAGVTSRARLGVAVLNAPFFAPALLAKQLATVDILSGGRLDVGLGLGWMEQEYAATGVPYRDRGARLEEHLRCLYALWADDPVEFHGRFYDVPPTHADPKPVQRPRPPVVLGGTVEAALRRAGRLADGWVSSSRADLGRIGQSIAVVRAGAEEAGRDPAAVRVVVRGVVLLGSDEGKPLAGSPEKVREDLAWLGEQGVTEVFVDLNFDPRVPTADPATAMRMAEDALEALAPSR
ncbi:MAG TPA: TIGR03619 family F420-dependent LLM class oxidoreductase [Mycobacteriales bacterium]|jgi:probable F420-dependent oxidoreductase|nr:TIGR03619 family F420-dependent LLM class oxidoreductase [Mycobacteriales bacterium]